MEEINKPKAQFVTKTEISRKTIKQCSRDGLPDSHIFKVYVGGCILFVLVGTLAILGRNLGLGIVAIVAFFVFSALIFAILYAGDNLTMKGIYKHYGPDSFFAESGFRDDAVYVTNERSQVTKTIPYEKIAYMTNKKNYLYLINEKGTAIMVNKSQLSGEELSRLMAFLQEKGIQNRPHAWPK